MILVVFSPFRRTMLCYIIIYSLSNDLVLVQEAMRSLLVMELERSCSILGKVTFGVG